MRTSPLAMRRRIEDEKSRITDEQLFASEEFAAYLTDIAEAAAGRYKRRIRVLTFWDPSPGSPLADTNNRLIRINAGNAITQAFPTRKLRADSLVGMAGHEVGHLLFTDFKMLNTYMQALEGGRFYPDVPKAQTHAQQKALTEILDYLESRNQAAMWAVQRMAHDLINILEDVYIEARMCDAFPGSFKTGILLNNYQMLEKSLSIKQQIDSGCSPSSIATNLILQYARCGDINNLEDYQGQYLDTFYQCVPFIDEAAYDDDARIRFIAANQMLLILAPYLQDLIRQAQEHMSQGKSLSDLDETLDGQQEAMPSLPDSTRNAAKAGHYHHDPAKAQEARDEIQQVMEQETGRMALEKTDELSERNDGSITYDRDYAGSGYISCAEADMQRILTQLAEDRAVALYEDELTQELQAEADSIRYGNIHKGYPVNINRISYVTDEMMESYARIAPPLLLLSKRMQKTVSQVLKDMREGAKLDNLLLGRRINARSLYRNDGHYFYKNRLPDSPSIAIGLLLDESGSMSSKDRITYARAAAIIIYNFCKSLGIPVIVYGHTEDYRDVVQLYAYAEFDSIDNKDMYRMMDISARSGNRDGAALRYMAERLLHRDEIIKLLFLVSDGQPAGTDYYGTEAEADLRGIKKEYENKGIQLFAAAIGDDKPNIQRIYRDGFLDITDLEKLPENIARLIIGYIKAKAV